MELLPCPRVSSLPIWRWQYAEKNKEAKAAPPAEEKGMITMRNVVNIADRCCKVIARNEAGSNPLITGVASYEAKQTHSRTSLRGTKQSHIYDLNHHLHTSSSHRSIHFGFMDSISLILQSLLPPLILFSSVIASTIVS